MELPPIQSSKNPQGSYQTLSFEDRLYIITTVNALPSAQFEQLIVALNIPEGCIPPDSAFQSQRSKALLDWAKGPNSLGLAGIDRVLQVCIPGAIEPKVLILSAGMGELSTAAVNGIVQQLRQKTRHDSITLAFYMKDSTKLVLNGPPEGLDQLQKLFDSGELTDILDKRSVESAYSIPSDTTEARKARLIQALILGEQDIRSHRDIAEAIAIDLDRISHCNRVASLLKLLEGVRDRVSALDNVHDRVSARTLSRILVLTINRVYERVRAYNTGSGRGYISDVLTALNQDRFGDALNLLDQALVQDQTIVQDLLNKRDIASDLNRARDSARTLTHVFNSTRTRSLVGIDLRGANLKGLNLVSIDLTETDLTDAIVEDTMFGNNLGLTGTDKKVLKQHGAIFQEASGSKISQNPSSNLDYDNAQTDG